jgi:hypothetical protein
LKNKTHSNPAQMQHWNWRTFDLYALLFLADMYT